MQLNFSFKLSRERFATYSHYLILVVSVVLVGLLSYNNYIKNSSPVETNYVLLKNDTTKILNDDNPTVDSILKDTKHAPLLPLAGTLMVSSDSSVFIEERFEENKENTNGSQNQKVSKKIEDINEEAQTWFRLIIDFFETVSPLLGPVVSYYFVRRERKKSDQSN